MQSSLLWEKLLLTPVAALLLALALWSPMLAQEQKPETPLPVEVMAELIPEHTQVQLGEKVHLAIVITNRSPFTLTQLGLYPLGADLIWWQEPIPLSDIPPYGVIHRYPITCTVSGPHPRPLAVLRYARADAVGIQRQAGVPLWGNALQVVTPPSFWSALHPWIPDMLIATASVAFALLSIFLSSRLTKKRQRERDRERVLGILEMLSAEALHGAQHGLRVNTRALRDLFMEEGLYEAMAQLDKRQGVEKGKGIVAAALQLWRTARQHNVGLGQAGGTQRIKELEEAVKNLRRATGETEGETEETLPPSRHASPRR